MDATDRLDLQVIRDDDDGATSIAHLHILVVDDDRFVADLLRLGLQSIGAETVDTCDDGSAVLRKLDHHRVDVLLLDINMPGMDGVELLRHLAGRDDAPAIILVTAEGPRILQTAHQLAQAHRLNVLGAISKPVRPAQLHELLTRHVVSGGSEEPCAPGPSAVRPFELTPQQVRGGLEAGNAIVPWFQPKVAAGSGRVAGVEALARWHDPERGIIPPSAFIPVAERSGLIKPLTRAVVEAAMAVAGQWHRRGVRLTVAVNVSVLDVEDTDFVDFMTAAAAERGVAPGHVVLEVTESRIVDRVAAALETLTRLRLRGFELAVDDYGTGASTLEQVRRLPVDEIKIDRSFVDGASNDSALRAMLSSTVALAEQLDLRTVAEGVEDRRDWDLARDLGVDLVQGFGIARPMPAEALSAWLADWEAARG